jgi:hypothetical protein
MTGLKSFGGAATVAWVEYEHEQKHRQGHVLGITGFFYDEALCHVISGLIRFFFGETLRDVCTSPF